MNCCNKPPTSSPKSHPVGVSTRFDIEFDYDFGMGSKSFVIKSDLDEDSCETKYMDALSIVEGNQNLREARAAARQEEESNATAAAAATSSQGKHSKRETRNAQQYCQQKEDERRVERRLSRIQIKQQHSGDLEEVEIEIPVDSTKSISRQSSQVSSCCSCGHVTASNTTSSNYDGRPPLAISKNHSSSLNYNATTSLEEMHQKWRESQEELHKTQKQFLASQNELENIREKAHNVKHELSNFKREWEAQQDNISAKEKEMMKLRSELLAKTNLLAEKDHDLHQTRVALENCHNKLESKMILNANQFEELQKCQKELKETKKELSNTRAELSRTKLQLESSTKRKKQFSSKALKILTGEIPSDCDKSSMPPTGQRPRANSCSNLEKSLGHENGKEDPPTQSLEENIETVQAAAKPSTENQSNAVQTQDMGIQTDFSLESSETATSQQPISSKPPAANKDVPMSKPSRTMDSGDDNYHDYNNTVANTTVVSTKKISSFRQLANRQESEDISDDKTVDCIFGQWNDTSSTMTSTGMCSSASADYYDEEQEHPDNNQANERSSKCSYEDNVLEYTDTFTAAPSRSSTYVTTTYSSTSSVSLSMANSDESEHEQHQQESNERQEKRKVQDLVRHISALSTKHDAATDDSTTPMPVSTPKRKRAVITAMTAFISFFVALCFSSVIQSERISHFLGISYHEGWLKVMTTPSAIYTLCAIVAMYFTTVWVIVESHCQYFFATKQALIASHVKPCSITCDDRYSTGIPKPRMVKTSS